jgi:universal stress protein A
MGEYTNILAAVDLSPEAEKVARRAANLALVSNAQLHLIHVVEPVNFAYGSDVPIDFSAIQDEIRKQAETQLTELSRLLGVTTVQHLAAGRAEIEIHALAEKINADLIVVGSHGRHGLALLLGSTANSVLHGAKSDVLAVRVGNKNK